MMPERRLWAAAAMLVLTDTRTKINAARKGRGYVRIDNQPVLIGTEEEEIAAARRYFASTDWREVATNAGLEDVRPDNALAFVVEHVTPAKPKRKST